MDADIEVAKPKAPVKQVDQNQPKKSETPHVL